MNNDGFEEESRNRQEREVIPFEYKLKLVGTGEVIQSGSK